MIEERSSPFEKVRVADASPRESWMAAFDVKSMPSIRDIGQTANLPVLHDRSFARTAIAMGDTQKGAFQVLIDGVDASQLDKDPRVAQLKRMIDKDVDVISKQGPSVKPAAAIDGPVRNVMGLSLDRSEAEVKPPALTGAVLADMKERAKGLPQHLRGRMKALEQVASSIRKQRKDGSIDDRAAMTALADVSEKAFLVAEGGKSADQRRDEARNGKVDFLFAASAHATREASRLGEEKKFSRGLVSDVMASEQKDRVDGKRGLRIGDDFIGTAKRLQRLGLVGKEDPRAMTDGRPVMALMNEPAPVKQNFEDAMVKEMTPPEGNVEAALAEKRKKEKEALAVRREYKEGTAPTSYQQVGLSGRNLAREVGQDNDAAHEDRERAAQLRKRHKEEAKKEATFAQAGYAETAMMDGYKKGRDKEKVRMASIATATRANTGVQQVSRSIEQSRKPVQQQPRAARQQAQR